MKLFGKPGADNRVVVTSGPLKGKTGRVTDSFISPAHRGFACAVVLDAGQGPDSGRTVTLGETEIAAL